MSPSEDPARRTGPATAVSAATGAGVRIAVDAMGGDHGPAEVVPGAIAYARANPADTVLLVGDEAVVTRLAGTLPANVRVVHAP